MKQWLSRLLDMRNFGLALGILSLSALLLGSFVEHNSLLLHQIFLDMWGNVSSELAGIAVTVLVIDSLNQRRQNELEERQEKGRLTRQLGSTVNSETRRAIEELIVKNWLFDGSLHHADLSEADLTKAHLANANLKGVNLRNALLSEATLRDANLAQANLDGADLSYVVLDGTDFTGASLKRCRFKGAQLSGNGLPDAITRSANLLTLLRTPETDLQNRDFSSLNLAEANLADKRLAQSNFFHADVRFVVFRNSDLSQTNFGDAEVTEANFEECRLLNANFYGANLLKANLNSCDMQYANLDNATLADASLINANLNKASLRSAVLTNADLTGVQELTEIQLRSCDALRGATLPNGIRYDGRLNLPGDIAAAKSRGFNLTDPADMKRFYSEG